MDRMTDERLAEIEREHTWRARCGDCDYYDGEELLQALKADRERIEALEAEIDRMRSSFPLAKVVKLEDDYAELEARLDAVRNCKRYLCEFPGIGKIGGAYRARDIDAALEKTE